ncbi:hypothetical protein JCM6882_007054 [Rhodosporidiobolus microsporus]
MATTAPRPNATRPERLAASSKRTSKASLLQLYQQLLPLAPAQPSLLNTFLSSLKPFACSSLDPQRIDAVWDELTQSVWVKDEAQMRRLWRQGFFGKGFLSRSEPSWRRRVENRRAELEGREKRLTSEEITAQRRIERKGTKLVKKAERDAERLLAASAAASAAGSVPPSPALSASSSSTPLPTLAEELEPRLEKVVEEREADEEEEEKEVPPEPWQLEAEHTQLQPEEAFFLLFSLDCLSLTTSSPLSDPPSLSSSTLTPPPRLSILESFALFLRSAVPSIPPSVALDPKTDPRLTRLDSPFLLNYAAYHHYRSMGWVVRSGVKFCVDWVLYGQGGPVGGHAEFAVVILPSYVDPRDSLTNPFRSTSSYLAIDQDVESRFPDLASNGPDEEHLAGEGERKNSWRWFHTVNRVCSGVKKTLVLLHVVIPPLSSLPANDPTWVADHPAQALAKLEMREIVMRRFLAGRSRD